MVRCEPFASLEPRGRGTAHMEAAHRFLQFRIACRKAQPE